MRRALPVALAAGAACAAILAAGLAMSTACHAGQEEAPAGKDSFELPRCSAGDVEDETKLLAELEGAGLKLESAHAHPGGGGGAELTYAGGGLWVRLLADGGLACALAAGRDEETSA